MSTYQLAGPRPGAIRVLTLNLWERGEHGGPTLKITSCQRIFDQPINGTWASDHFGLIADLTIP